MTELHVHLDGSLRAETVKELATELATEYDVSKLRVTEGCRSLNEYLECFRLPLLVLQKEAAISRAVLELAEDLRADGVRAAEIRFAPLSFCGEKLTLEEAVAAAVRGAEEAKKKLPDLRLGLILCCMRGQEEASFIGSTRADLTGEEANRRVIEEAARVKGKIVRGADLAGAEALYPTSRYKELFLYAGSLSLPFTIHAGEAAGPKSVWEALETGTKRIGHGVRAIEEPLLVEELVRQKITLECCVTSNLHTGICADAKDHPIRRLFDAGVRVTVSTDNRTVSDTTMTKEIELLQRKLSFSDAEIRTMEEYAQEALF